MMKFHTTTSVLKKITEAAAGVISSNTVLPILEDFQFRCIDRKLYITTTDLETTILAYTDIEHDSNGTVSIPGKLLVNLLKSLPEETIKFNIGKGNEIEIKTDSGKYKLQGEPGDDFPKVPPIDNDDKILMKGSTFLRIVKKSLFAIGNDELRPAMTGMFMEHTDDKTNFVCTDAHKLSHTELRQNVTGKNFNFILPKKALQLLSAQIPDDENEITIQYNDKHAFFSFGNYTLICRLVDARFPDYKAVIPTSPAKTAIINSNELLNTLRRCTLFSPKVTHQISLTFTKDKIQVQSNDLDFSSEATEEIKCEYDGEEITMSFNGYFLTDIISSLGTPDIKLMFDSPTRASIIHPVPQVEHEDTLMLIMPIMVNN